MYPIHSTFFPLFSSKLCWFLLLVLLIGVQKSGRVFSIENYVDIFLESLSTLALSFCVFLVTLRWSHRFVWYSFHPHHLHHPYGISPYRSIYSLQCINCILRQIENVIIPCCQHFDYCFILFSCCYWCSCVAICVPHAFWGIIYNSICYSISIWGMVGPISISFLSLSSSH